MFSSVVGRLWRRPTGVIYCGRHYQALYNQSEQCTAEKLPCHHFSGTLSPLHGQIRTFSPLHRPISQFGGTWQARCYHATTPIREETGESYDKQLKRLFRKKYENSPNVDLEAIEDLLTHIEKETDTVLKTDTFKMMATRCARRSSLESAQAAETLLFDWMIKFHLQDRLDDPNRAEDAFGAAFRCWRISEHSSSGKRSEQLLDRMEHMAKQGILPFELSIFSYNEVIRKYAKLGHVENAQAILDRCVHAFDQGNENVQPNIYSWNFIVGACANSGKPNAWQIAETIFEQMKESHQQGKCKDLPNTTTYNAICRACANSNQPEKAEFWLDEMHKSYLEGNPSAQPATTSFNAVLDAWAQSDASEGAQRCEQILDHMIKLTNEGTLPVPPDTDSYNFVITAYASRGLPIDAQRVLLEQYKAFQKGNKAAALTIRSFNEIINGWTLAKETNSGKQAELVLQRALELVSPGILREIPNACTYTNVISTWAVLGEPERASQIFARMLGDYAGDCKPKVLKPTLATFSSLLQSYLVANSKEAGEKADEFLKQMDELGLVPDRSIYNGVMNCWECSLEHGYPRAKERCRELQAHIESLEDDSPQSAQA